MMKARVSFALWLLLFSPVRVTAQGDPLAEMAADCEKQVAEAKKMMNDALVEDKKPLPKESGMRDVTLIGRQQNFIAASQFALVAKKCFLMMGDLNPPSVLDDLLRISDEHRAAIKREQDKYITPLPNLIDQELNRRP